MKKLFFGLALCAALWMSACSNDFEATAPWKEIPVTYALLAAKDTVHYIRVEKAFLDPDESALKVAQIADSLYYPADAITVSLQKIAANGSVEKTYALTRVNGQDEGIVRDSGIFATVPNYLYKLVTPGADKLVAGARYRVVIKRADGKPDVTGQTTIPSDLRWADPTLQSINNELHTLNFDTAGVLQLGWRADEFAVYFKVKLLIRYKETDAVTGALLNRDSLLWDLSNSQIDALPSGKYLLYSPSLYQFLHDKLSSATDRRRTFEECSFSIEGGGLEIKRLNETLSANSGITSAEVIPLYTNMSEGFGIVAAKNDRITPSVKRTIIGTETITRIRNHPLTKGLNF